MEHTSYGIKKKTILIIIVGVLIVSAIFLFLNKQNINIQDLLNKEENKISSQVLLTSEVNKSLNSLGIEGITLNSFKVNSEEFDTRSKNNSDYFFYDTYTKKDGFLKHEMYLKNKNGFTKDYNLSILIKIDYDQVRWNGSVYNLNTKVQRLDPFLQDGILIAPNIFMDDVYNKRVNFQDVADLGGYAIIYSDKVNNYIEFIVENIVIDSKSTFILDPSYSNITDGFSTISAGSIQAEGINFNGSDIFVLDDSDNFVYHFNTLGVNQSDGFNVAGSTSYKGLTTNGSDYYIVEDSIVAEIQHYSSAGVVISADVINLETSIGAENPEGVTTNGSDFWVVDTSDAFVYHINSDGLNDTSDGFSISSFASLSPVGISTNGSDFYIVDHFDDFVYHSNYDGVNQTDGFDISSFGSAFPQGISSNGSDMYIIDQTDDFVYHVRLNNPYVDLVTPTHGTDSLSGSVEITANMTMDFNLMTQFDLYYNSTDVGWHLNKSFYPELPNDNVTDTYNDIDMRGNLILLHLNNDSALGESETIINDTSGSGFNLTRTGTATVNNSGLFGGAWSFNTNGRLTMNDESKLEGMDNITISVWVYPEDVGDADYQAVVAKRSVYYIRKAQNSGIINGVLFAGGTTSFDSTNPMIEDQWNHIALRYNGTTGSIWLNGVEDAIVDMAGGSLDESTDRFVVGSDDQATFGGSYWNGMIDEVSIWNRSLKDDEMLRLYNVTQQYKINHSLTGLADNVYEWNIEAHSNVNRFSFASFNYTFEVGAAGPDSCTCTDAQDWKVDCSDNCKLASQCDINDFDLTLSGSGTFTLAANLYVDRILKDKQCKVFNEKNDGSSFIVKKG